MKILSALLTLSVLAAPVFVSSIALAQGAAKPVITITDAYAFAVPDGAKVGAAFMTLTYANGTDIVPDRITHVSTPAAGKSEIHTMTLDNNVMTMRPVDSFPLPPTGSFALKPDGVHVMLIGLKRNLKAGEQFPLTLTFAKAGEVKVDVKIRPPGQIDEPEEEKAVHEDMKTDAGMNHEMHH